MKKFIMCLFLLCAMVCVFAQDDVSVQNNVSAMPNVRLLLDRGFYANEDLIRQESINLTAVEKSLLFNQYEEEVWIPLAINFFVGYGIGSFVQGDTVGGIIGVSGDLIGTGVVLAGFIPMINLVSSPYNPAASDASVSTAYTEFLIYYAVGGAVMLGSRIFQLVRPVVFTNSFNKDLRNALGMAGVSYQIAPTYDFENNEPGIVASVSLNL